MKPTSSICGGVGRRTFLRLSGAAAALGLVSVPKLSGLAYADALTQEQREKMSPQQILELMQHGNERFREGSRKERSYLAEQRASATGQHPAACILSCIDSRAPAEVIMDLGIGDVFNARVAGNISNDDILGSMEYACKVVGSKVILVMGHTGCGAIKGAIDGAQLGHLTALLAKIRPAVEKTRYDGDRTGKNATFVDAVARTNVDLTISQIREQSPVLRGLEAAGELRIAGAMYDLNTAVVTFSA